MAIQITWEELMAHERKLVDKISILNRRTQNIKSALETGNHASPEPALRFVLEECNLRLVENRINLKNTQIALHQCR